MKKHMRTLYKRSTRTYAMLNPILHSMESFKFVDNFKAKYKIRRRKISWFVSLQVEILQAAAKLQIQIKGVMKHHDSKHIKPDANIRSYMTDHWPIEDRKMYLWCIGGFMILYRTVCNNRDRFSITSSIFMDAGTLWTIQSTNNSKSENVFIMSKKLSKNIHKEIK